MIVQMLSNCCGLPTYTIRASYTEEQIQQFITIDITTNKNQEVHIHALLESGIDYNINSFELLIDNLINDFGIEICIREIFYPLLQRIGLLWLTSHVIPAQEHFVSNIMRSKIIIAIDGIRNQQNGITDVLIFSPAGEIHELPLLTANYFFKKYNYSTVYFGCNVSFSTIHYYLTHHPIETIYLHVITILNNADLNESICHFCKMHPDKKIISS